MALLFTLTQDREDKVRNYVQQLILFALFVQPLAAHAFKLDQFVECFIKRTHQALAPEPEIVKDPEGLAYYLTDRPFENIEAEKLYPSEVLSRDELEGQTILDVPAGKTGAALKGFRKAGAKTVIGVDREGDGKNVLRGDAQALPMASKSIDAIYSTWGFFAGLYERRLPDEFFFGVFKEFHRVLKTGGVIRISPVGDVTRISALVRKVSGLRISVRQQRVIYPLPNQPITRFYMEIQRVN